MSTYREERIRQLAHKIWEMEGHPHGRDAEHWRMATEAYEAELTGSRLDDAGRPIEMGLEPAQEQTMYRPAAASKAGRGRKLQAETARLAEETSPDARRKRRTKAEMAAAAAGITGAATAVAATVVVTKRRRSAMAGTEGEAAPAPAGDATLRPPRKARGGRTVSEAEPAPVALTTDVVTGPIPDPSAAGPSALATNLIPDPSAEPPSDAALETYTESAPEANLTSRSVAD
jgi:hypothetical protein